MDTLESILDKISLIEKWLTPRPPIDATPLISTTQPLIVDYKDRKHLYIWSANSLTLTLEDIGTLTVSANTWTNIGYQQGMRLVPTSQASTVPVFVRASDEVIP